MQAPALWHCTCANSLPVCITDNIYFKHKLLFTLGGFYNEKDELAASR